MTTEIVTIPSDPEAALEMVKAGTLVANEEPVAGTNIGLFSITVPNKDDADNPFYDSKGTFQPFEYKYFDNLPAILEEEGADIDDSQVNMLNAFVASSDKTAKAVKNVVDNYNSITRANAKQAEYSRITNLKKPMSEETKAKKIESMVTFFATMNSISLEKARQTLQDRGMFDRV